MRALILLVLGGCSFIFVAAPPRNATPDADCTESRIAPGVDTVVALGLGAIAIASLAASKPSCTGDCLPSEVGQGVATAVGGAMIVPAIIYGVSAFGGFDKTGACRDLHATRQAPMMTSSMGRP